MIDGGEPKNRPLMGAESDLRNFEYSRCIEKRDFESPCRNKSRGSTGNGGSVKGWARRWAHADFGEGKGVTWRILAKTKGNTQQNMLLRGCFSK